MSLETVETILFNSGPILICILKIQNAKLLYICDNLKRMVEFKENFSLLSFNTFGINASANYFANICNELEIDELIDSEPFRKNSRLILGGGSNILFTDDFTGLVIHPAFGGIEIIDETKTDVVVKCGSGVVWDELVQYAVEKDWGGIENLSYIPGNVGACPIQNIGAYGADIKQVVEKVEGIDLRNKKRLSFLPEECKFGYRDSIFKKELKNDFLITHVSFRLKKPPHKLNVSYSVLAKEFENYNEKTIQSIRDIVIEIRRSKLPEVTELGSAGSFFKNPVVPNDIANKIFSAYPDCPKFRSENGQFKLSAAWLIDRSGCKGLQFGDASTYILQPLVIVNLGNASGKDIVLLSKTIQEKVFERFGLMLEPEVNFV
jgi:UDP-N-acetylmuramate dehydrogenase